MNHLCVSKKCVTPDTFPLLQISFAAGDFGQSHSAALLPQIHLSAPRAAAGQEWSPEAAGSRARTLFVENQSPLSLAKLAKDLVSTEQSKLLFIQCDLLQGRYKMFLQEL